LLVCSIRLRPPTAIVQESWTSTLSNPVPRSVAIESVVTVPLGARVNLVTPLAVGYLLIVTASVAFFEKGAGLAAVFIRLCTNEEIYYNYYSSAGATEGVCLALDT